MADRERVEECLIFVTRDTEYLFQGRQCVRLRDRRTGLWESVRPNRLLGVLRPGESDPELAPGDGGPRVGDRLCMLIGGTRLLSAPILRIERAAFAALQVWQAPDGSISLFAEVGSPRMRAGLV